MADPVGGTDDVITIRSLTASATWSILRAMRRSPYPGAPHCLTSTHQDQINAGLPIVSTSRHEKERCDVQDEE